MTNGPKVTLVVNTLNHREIEQEAETFVEQVREIASSTAITTCAANEWLPRYSELTEAVLDALPAWMESHIHLMREDQARFWSQLTFFVRDSIQEAGREARSDD